MKRISILLLAVCLCFACSRRQSAEVENSMVYRELGATGLSVGEIGIGCAAFGKMDTAQARAFMDVALDSGVNYIDIYDADPKVRGNIGYALQGRRDCMIIQGHIGSFWNGEKYERTFDVEKAKKGFEDLLSLLQTDHIEVGMIHIVDCPILWDSVLKSPFMDYVRQLKSEGKIKHIGLSSHNAAAALAAAKSGEVEVIMFSLNPAFDRLPAGVNPWDKESYSQMSAGIDPVRMELYDYCATHHIAVTAMKVFGSGGGRLLDAEGSPLGQKLTPVQCLAYALSKPCVATAVCGACTIEELQADLAYLHATDAEKEYALDATAENRGDGNCTYCNHCSPCPVGIDIAKVNRLLDEAKKHETIPEEVMAEYKALEHKAGECRDCGACESRCPFDVPVRERMHEAAALFGE